MGIHLTFKQAHCQAVFFILCFGINREQHFTGIEAVDVVFFELIAFDCSVAVDYRICIAQCIVVILFVSGFPIDIVNGLQLKSVAVVPLQIF